MLAPRQGSIGQHISSSGESASGTDSIILERTGGETQQVTALDDVWRLNIENVYTMKNPGELAKVPEIINECKRKRAISVNTDSV